MLGPDYQVAEVGFDVSFSGSKFQPWHRDFRKHVGMREDGSLCALAFNLPTVDVVEEMGRSRWCSAPRTTRSPSTTGCSPMPSSRPAMRPIRGARRPSPSAATFYDALPAQAREHMHCEVVEQLERIDQGHDIEGLVMGEE